MIGGALLLQYIETAIRFMEKAESGKQGGEGKTRADGLRVYPESAENARKREKSRKHRRRILQIENGLFRKEFPQYTGEGMRFSTENPRPEKARIFGTDSLSKRFVINESEAAKVR